jgi:hypothetical protein
MKTTTLHVIHNWLKWQGHKGNKLHGVLWFRQFVTNFPLWKPRFHPRAVCVECVVDRQAMGQVSLRILHFPPAYYHPTTAPYSYLIHLLLILQKHRNWQHLSVKPTKNSMHTANTRFQAKSIAHTNVEVSEQNEPIVHVRNVFNNIISITALCKIAHVTWLTSESSQAGIGFNPSHIQWLTLIRSESNYSFCSNDTVISIQSFIQ